MTNNNGHTLITVRANGKCHPAMRFADGFVVIQCNCPGSKNGSLANRAVKVADGHESANCRAKEV
jgi:hypothetical protein